jgi:hypothetical protein
VIGRRSKMELLSNELVAGYTGQQVLIAVAALVAVLLLLKAVFGGGKKQEPVHTVLGRCACGWSGNVSKFTRKCPMCNSEIHVRGG